MSTLDNIDVRNFKPPTFINNRLEVFFFTRQGWDLFAFAIALFQKLIYPSASLWNSPVHVGFSYKGKYYELTQEGTTCVGGDNFELVEETAREVSSDSVVRFLTEEEDDVLQMFLVSMVDYDYRFSFRQTARFLIRRLLRKQKQELFESMGAAVFSTYDRVLSSNTAFFVPPLTCTAPIWLSLEGLEVEPLSFLPQVLLEQLTERN